MKAFCIGRWKGGYYQAVYETIEEAEAAIDLLRQDPEADLREYKINEILIEFFVDKATGRLTNYVTKEQLVATIFPIVVWKKEAV